MEVLSTHLQLTSQFDWLIEMSGELKIQACEGQLRISNFRLIVCGTVHFAKEILVWKCFSLTYHSNLKQAVFTVF